MMLWHKGDRWTGTPLATPLALGEGRESSVVPFVLGGRARAALVTAPGARVLLNGYPPLGVAVLEHRDEIAYADEHFVFVGYASADPKPWPSDAPETPCARCKGALLAGESVVRCPACDAGQHETAERQCFSYDPRCGGCGRLHAELGWTPQEAEDDAAA